MEAVPRNASHVPGHGVQCLDCGIEVPLYAMADHRCHPSTTAMSPPVRIDTASHRGPVRPRPPLPKIDPSAARRPRAFRGDVTPTASSSSHSSRVTSPVSASSGSRSPWPQRRKGSIAHVQRSPSPELTNLDCAFPPFPMPARQATTKRRERGRTDRSDTHRSRSRDGAQKARPAPPARAGSANHPSNTLHAPQETASQPQSPVVSPDVGRSWVTKTPNKVDDRQHGTRGAMPSNGEPPLSSPEQSGAAPPAPPPPAPPPPPTPVQRPVRNNTDPGGGVVPHVDETLGAFHFGAGAIAPRSPTNGTALTVSRSETEPSYRAKRPPPLPQGNARPRPAQASPPVAPQSATVLPRGLGLGRLFGRQRSQSTAARRDVVKQALADEADDGPATAAGRGLLSPTSDGSFLTAEPSPLTDRSYFPPEPSPLTDVSDAGFPSPAPSLCHEESLRALEGAPSPSPPPRADSLVAVAESRHVDARRSPIFERRDRPLEQPQASDDPEPHPNLSLPISGSPSARGHALACRDDETHAPMPSPSITASLNALEGLVPPPAEALMPQVVVESVQPAPGNDRGLGTSPATPEAAPPLPAAEMVPASDHGQFIEKLRRASIDSMSSYGSVGFSEMPSSSRSSSPRTESTVNRSFDALYDAFLKPTDADVPPPLRPKHVEVLPLPLPQSPTDLLLHHGRLTPIADLVDPVADVADRPSEPSAAPTSTTPAVPTIQTPNPNKGLCKGCRQVIQSTQKSVSSADGRLTGRYHKECFVCQTCRAPFPTAEFYVHHDQPYCGHHYHELEDSLCATCRQGIEGLYMETANVAGRGKEKHHPGCLKCATCQQRLDHDYFELSGVVYCERDAFRLASGPRSRDNAPARPSPLIREYITSGDPGLVKGRNFPERRTTRMMTMT